MSGTRESTIVKYVAALNILKGTLGVNPKASISQIATVCKISNTFAQGAKKYGVIVETDEGHAWCGGEVSEELAQKLISDHAKSTLRKSESDKIPCVDDVHSTESLERMIDILREQTELLRQLVSIWNAPVAGEL